MLSQLVDVALVLLSFGQLSGACLADAQVKEGRSRNAMRIEFVDELN